MKRLTSIVVFLWGALLLSGCSESPELAATSETFSKVSKVRYVLERSAGQSTFASDRGYAIQLERMYLAYSSVGLSKCSPAVPRVMSAWLRHVLFVPVAHAGHEGVIDPSYAGEGWVFDLLHGPRSQTIAERFFPLTSYCRVASVNGRADESFHHYPAGVSLSGYSMHVRGRYTSPAGTDVPFVLETGLAYGKSRDLPNHPGKETRTITFVHDIASAFSGVMLTGDLELASKQTLKNLVDHTRVDVGL